MYQKDNTLSLFAEHCMKLCSVGNYQFLISGNKQEYGKAKTDSIEYRKAVKTLCVIHYNKLKLDPHGREIYLKLM